MWKSLVKGANSHKRLLATTFLSKTANIHKTLCKTEKKEEVKTAWEDHIHTHTHTHKENRAHHNQVSNTTTSNHSFHNVWSTVIILQECWNLCSKEVGWYLTPGQYARTYGAAFRKVICMSRSPSHTSKSKVICRATFPGVKATGETLHGYKFFSRVKVQWIEWKWHPSRNLRLCSVNCAWSTEQQCFV